MPANPKKHKGPSKNAQKERKLLLDLKPRTNKKSNKIINWWHNRRWWLKAAIIVSIFTLIFVGQAYGIAYWYQQKHKNEPIHLGVTFISDYAKYFSLDPHETFMALRDDLGFKRFRLVSYWEDIEKSPGVYDFSDLDWQFNKVNEVSGEVTLSIGLRQPRWPECHAPDWVENQPYDKWYPALNQFMTATINHYKNNPALKSYQLENEFFLGVFGDCADFSSKRERLIQEFNLVKSIDPNHPIILSLANNYFGIPIGQPRADQVGISVYKRVWDKTVTHRYFEYPFPSWYYSWRSGLTELVTGRDSMLHELQAEPWPPGGLLEASIAEQDKSMNANRLTERIQYGKDTGFKDIDLWGGEWWYWRKTKFNDPSLWNVVKTELAKPEYSTQKN